jgi:hypothetical protein
MNNIYDVLEICLQEFESGADLETVLARYPDLASELRPLLNASVVVRTRSELVSAPSPDAVRRGRAKLLQHAAQMREAKVSLRKRMIPTFQRLAISFTLTALFLTSGTGLVSASSSALPGENLYPVKRTWEDVRLFFTFNPDRKYLLESEFESERLNEVGELLTEGRDETIQYSGVFMQVKSVMYVSGVKVLIPANLQVPADGAAVTITGRTNAQGYVEIESIELLPDGAVVPVGEPVEGDNESDSGLGSGSSSENKADSNSGSALENGSVPSSSNEAQGSDTSDTNEAPKSDPQSFEIKGIVNSVSNNTLVVDGQTVQLDNAKIDGKLKSGVNVEIKGFYTADGSFITTEVKVKDSRSGGSGGNENLNSGSNSNDNSGSNSKDGGSDNSGSGGGGGDSGGGGGDNGGGGSGGGDD